MFYNPLHPIVAKLFELIRKIYEQKLRSFKKRIRRKQVNKWKYETSILSYMYMNVCRKNSSRNFWLSHTVSDGRMDIANQRVVSLHTIHIGKQIKRGCLTIKMNDQSWKYRAAV